MQKKQIKNKPVIKLDAIRLVAVNFIKHLDSSDSKFAESKQARNAFKRKSAALPG